MDVTKVANPAKTKKGLITFDRAIKKDAFYIYKAYLSDEPFVHLCGRRYADRTEDTTEIKVYTNQSTVVLYLDGTEVETKTGDKVFTFAVPLSGQHEVRATAGECADCMTLRKVAEPNKDYAKDGVAVVNWFDRDDEIEREGYYSIKDSMADIKASQEASTLLNEMIAPMQAKLTAAYGDVAKNVQMPPEMQAMMDRMSVEQSLKQMAKLITPEFVHRVNYALNQVKKEV